MAMRLVIAGGSDGGSARRRPPYFRHKKVAVIGCTQSSQFAPWHDPSWTIVTHCSARQLCRREPDWYFDLHPRSCFTQEGKSWNRHYYTWLKRLQTPIFMQEDWPEIPAAVKFPKDRLLAEFRPFFTNHVAWMIALAMTEGVQTIGLFGCEYRAHTEHGTQRDSCVYWLGRFEGAGGRLVLPPRLTSLLNTPKELYGYESHDDHGLLVPSYRTKPAVTMEHENRWDEHRALTVIEMTDATNRPPLMACPAFAGGVVDWAHSGHAIHA